MVEMIINSDEELLKLAYELGNPIPSRINGQIIDTLMPLSENEAHQYSLSANFGINEFPFHTDGAYFKKPPKHILMRYIGSIDQPTPTIIGDLKYLDEDTMSELQFHVWKVKSRNSSFYSAILSDDQEIYRYDSCIMQPVSKRLPLDFFQRIVDTTPKHTVTWELNKTIVIDNWTTVHKRLQVQKHEINNRKLQRIMIL